MKILGIHDGHTATSCLLDAGNIKSTLSEERLTRVKGQGGFPEKSILKIFELENIKADEIDIIALVGKIKPLTSIREYSHGRQRYFPKLINIYPGNPRKLIEYYVKHQSGKRLKEKNILECFNKCGLDYRKVNIVEHHQTHAATAYYLSPFARKNVDTLVITMDGSGDGMAGSVSKIDHNGSWTRLAEISTYDSLGMVYSRITQLLAMKPWEHEFKLMGMAPYASPEYSGKVYSILKNYLGISKDGLNFINRKRFWGNSLLEKLRDELWQHRFDAISGGIQLLHERLLTEFIVNWIKKTGIKKVAVAGGCFMNIKANKLFMDSEFVDDLFVMPSCGDESCAIGAALWEYSRSRSAENGDIAPVGNLYWGPRYNDHEIEQVLNDFSSDIDYIKIPDIQRKTAELLAQHNIIGRFSGRMEWGSRALGNRSIIANASRLENIRKLNAAIKMRDFWMPFAPSIKWDRRFDYAVIEKDIPAYHMVMGFDSTPLAREHLIAALHPYDYTMRPQFVTQTHNPDYYEMLSEFEKITGYGGVLNTSFNLHGWPIVCSPIDAIKTFLNSDLDYLVIERYLVSKKIESEI